MEEKRLKSFVRYLQNEFLNYILNQPRFANLNKCMKTNVGMQNAFVMVIILINYFLNLFVFLCMQSLSMAFISGNTKVLMYALAVVYD